MAKRTTVKKYVIRDSSGTYFWEMVAIGPRFGVGLKDAKRFDSKEEAVRQMGVHYGFTTSKVEPVTDQT
jgi:hypothetical protein